MTADSPQAAVPVAAAKTDWAIALTPPRWREDETLQIVNRVLQSLKRPALEYLPQIFAGDAQTVLTFPVLDPYDMQRSEPLAGPVLAGQTDKALNAPRARSQALAEAVLGADARVRRKLRHATKAPLPPPQQPHLARLQSKRRRVSADGLDPRRPLPSTLAHPAQRLRSHPVRLHGFTGSGRKWVALKVSPVSSRHSPFVQQAITGTASGI